MAKRPNPSIPDDLYERVTEIMDVEGYTGGINQFIVKILREYVNKRDLSFELRNELEIYIAKRIDERFDQLLSSEQFKDLIRAIMDEVIQEEKPPEE